MAAALRDRRIRGALLLALLLVSTAVGVKVAPAHPVRADESQHQFQVSTLDLTGERRVAVLTGRDMVPGDTVTGALTLANPGRSPLDYRMIHGTVATEDRLAAALALDIRTAGSSCGDFDGLSLYHGSLATATFGHDAAGPRRLASASAEILCFRARLPIETGNEVQGAATKVTFRFDVEWTTSTP